jgi:hypothetical protein
MDSLQGEWAQRSPRCIPRPISVITTTTHPCPLTLPASTHALRTCRLSKNGAFCDGSHLQLIASTPQIRRPWWKFWG